MTALRSRSEKMVCRCVLIFILVVGFIYVEGAVKANADQSSGCSRPDSELCDRYTPREFYCTQGWLASHCCSYCQGVANTAVVPKTTGDESTKANSTAKAGSAAIRAGAVTKAADSEEKSETAIKNKGSVGKTERRSKSKGSTKKIKIVSKIKGSVKKSETVIKSKEHVKKKEPVKQAKGLIKKTKVVSKIEATTNKTTDESKEHPIAGCRPKNHLYCRFYKPKEKYCSRAWVKKNCCYLCEVAGEWTRWSEFGRCSVSCAVGSHTRTRTCRSLTAPYGLGTCFMHGGGEKGIKETESRVCRMSPCPIHGNWGDWSRSTTCTKTCGGGRQRRYRSCDNPSPLHGGLKCLLLGRGDVRDVQEVDVGVCNLQACPVQGMWSSWSEYGYCSVSCGGGVHSRRRECNNPAPAHGGLPCVLGDGSGKKHIREAESEICNIHRCPVHGNWGPWSKYRSCSLTCGGGEKTRFRLCDNPRPKHGGDDCLLSSEAFNTDTIEHHSEPCNVQLCPVDGGWSIWSAYTTCSLTCGGGEQTRNRTCDSPRPAYGGEQCVLSDESGVAMREMNKTVCNEETCPFPVDGAWGKWSDFLSCSVSCGGGEQIRSRTCNNPTPKNGGHDCLLSSNNGTRRTTETQISSCNLKACPGGWGEWNRFGECSTSCGGGTRRRRRLCDSPPPLKDGFKCLRSDKSGIRDLIDQETDACNTFSCPVDGNWGEWTDFISCSVSCGGGEKLRIRSCDNPFPRDGLYCLLSDGNGNRDMYESEISHCHTDPCPGENYWGEWSAFDVCNVSCGEGKRVRTRTCVDLDGTKCLIPDGRGRKESTETEKQACNTDVVCPEDVHLYSFAVAECND